MKVLNLRCANGHGFEGWFGSEDDFLRQNGRGLVECPLCADKIISKMPSAPRLNLSSARAAAGDEASQRAAAETSTSSNGASSGAQSSAPSPTESNDGPSPEMQALWMKAMREMVRRTEDVGPRFAEEARRMHYGEVPERGIRGKATPAEREALQEEGIETFSMPIPKGLDGPLQ